MKNKLIQIFMDDWEETRFGALTISKYEAVKALHNNGVEGVETCEIYNTPEPFHIQPEHIRLMVDEALEAATAYLTAQPEYHEAIERKLNRSKATFEEALESATPEEKYYLKHGTKGEF